MTAQLVREHPIRSDELVEVVLDTWRDVFESRIGKRGFRLGYEIKPTPQIMGNYLHELIPLEFEHRYPGVWRKQQSKDEKDLVHLPEDRFSIEIKSSSHKTNIFGNRSYGQQTLDNDGRKKKSGFYLAINFEKFGAGPELPQITKVRFGWLDHADWNPQGAATGQAARLLPQTERSKLLTLYPRGG